MHESEWPPALDILNVKMLTGVVVLQPVLSERVLYSVRDNSRDDHPRVQVRGRLRSR